MRKDQWTLFFCLTGGCILTLIAGTLSHEAAHYLAGLALGYEGYISYHATHYTLIPATDANYLPYRIPVILAGPLQTMLTGTVGYIILWKNRLSTTATGDLKPLGWMGVFIACFWLRQIALFLLWLLTLIIGRPSSFQGDEIKLAVYLNWPEWSIITVTGLTGILLMFQVFRKYIPTQQQMVFCLALLTGGLTGYLIWFEWLGKILLPEH